VHFLGVQKAKNLPKEALWVRFVLSCFTTFVYFLQFSRILDDFGLLFNNYILNVHKVGLYSTRFLIDRVRVLLLNEFLY
jgi:hypothetical protein